MVGWFLLPVVLGTGGYFVIRPMVASDSTPIVDTTQSSDAEEPTSKKFSAPKVTVTAQRTQTRRRGGLIGKRPRAVKKKVEAPKEDVIPAGATMGPDTGGGGTVAPPDSGGAPPTTSPGEGTGAAQGG